MDQFATLGASPANAGMDRQINRESGRVQRTTASIAGFASSSESAHSRQLQRNRFAQLLTDDIGDQLVKRSAVGECECR